jgi:hypothetical protein
VGQALTDLQDDFDAGLRRGCGQAFGIAERHVGGADLPRRKLSLLLSRLLAQWSEAGAHLV